MRGLSREWKEEKLENCTVQIFSGGTPSTKIPEYWNGIYPWLSSGETRNAFITTTEKTITEEGIEKSSTKLAQKYDVVIASAGQGNTRGQASLCKIDTYINQSIIAIRSKRDILEPNYLFYNIQGRYNELRKISDGHSIRGSLTTKIIKDLKIMLPPLEEQKTIANILSTLDEKIEVNNQINKKLEEMAQTIFKHWFVDFEFPNGNGEPYKSSGGEMVDSEFGMIPKGWEVKTIEDVTDAVSKGTTPTKKDIDTSIDEAIINFLKVKDIDDEGNISMNTLEKIPNSIHLNKLKRSILKKWDILFSIAGTIGRVATVDSRLDNSNANQAIAFIRLKEVEKMFVFILYLLKSENIQNEIKANVVQAVQANASLGTIKSLKYTLPTDNIIKKFNRIVFPIYNKQTNIRIESEQLTQLRDTLLPKLMSGELRIPLEEDDIS